MQNIWKNYVILLAVLCMLLPNCLIPAAAEDVFMELEGEDSFELELDSSDSEDEFHPVFNEDSEPEHPKDSGNRVPLYLQTDYPNVPYGGGSLATSGCSMVTIAMVASFLRGEKVEPEDLAQQFRHADGSHIQRMEAAATCLDLEYKKTFILGDVLNALRRDKVAVIMVGSRSDFTTTQHFLVLTGIREDGRIYVNDSNGNNYRKAELRDGFANGFTQVQLFQGFAGAWVFEGYVPPQKGQSQYGNLQLSQDERDMLAKLIWREARGETFEGQQAVAEVVLNRVVSDRFPTDDVINTIMAKDQFRTAKFMDDTTADPLQYKAIERALNGPNVIPMDVFFFARTENAGSKVWGRIGRHVFWK